MPLGIRLSVVAFVLLVGVGSAMLFRKQSPDTASANRSTSDPLLLRKAPTEAQPPATVVRAAAQHTDTAAPPEVSVLRKRTSRKIIPPPNLDTSFTTPLMPKRPENNFASGPDQPERFPKLDAPTESKPSHRVRLVVDGDSLKNLAKRYLGSASRYLEIYEANRDVLASPDLLPIGIKLKIPADAPPATKPIDKPNVVEQPTVPRMVPISR